MKILMFAHFYPPEMGGAGARLHGLARWLVRLGNEVTVITGLPNYPSGIIAPPYRGKLWMQEEVDGVTVVRAWVYASPKRGTVRRLLNYFSFVFSSIIAAVLHRQQYDIIIASSPPLFLGLSGLVLAKLKRIPWVFDIRDIWPDVAVEAGELAPDALVTRWSASLARFLYRQADHITPVTENKRMKIAEAAIPDVKQSVVTNGVDLDLVPLQPVEDRRQLLGLEGKFVVLYAGLIGIAQGLGIAIDAAEQLRADSRIHFLIVGDGVQREQIAERIAAAGLANVTMLGRQPREEIPALMATADVCLVPLVSSNLEDAVPSKLLEAWSFTRAVILAAGGEAAAIVNQCEGGKVVAPEAPQQLAQAIVQMQANPQQVKSYAQNGRKYVEQHFDRRVLAQRMEQVLQQVLQTYRPQSVAHAATVRPQQNEPVVK